MNQEVPPLDILFGALILIIFLVCAFIAGRFLSAWKNRRFTTAWAPLLPLVNGRVHHDGGGAASSWLIGTYQGWPVQASMTPDRNRYMEGGGRYNYFEIALLNVAGQQDWRIAYHASILDLDIPNWDIKTEDLSLGLRLQASGLIADLVGLGTPSLDYRAGERKLLYSEDVTPRWVPTPERFQALLEILLGLAAISGDISKV